MDLQKGLMIRICQFCHKKYNKKNLLFCSIVCSNKSRTGVPRPKQSERMSGEKNPRWTVNPSGKMDNLHQWVHKRKPKPKFCEICGTKPPMDLANVSQEYKKDPNDFIWLCRACHIRQDGRIKNLKQFAGGKI